MPIIHYKNGTKRNCADFSSCTSLSEAKNLFSQKVKDLEDPSEIQALLNNYNSCISKFGEVSTNAQADPNVGIAIPEVPTVVGPEDPTQVIEQPNPIEVTPDSSSIADESIVTQYSRLTGKTQVKSNTNPNASIIEHKESFRCLGFNN